MSRELHEAVRQGRIRQIPVILGPRDQKNRRLFWTGEVEEWCCKIAAMQQSRSLLNYGEQLNLIFAEFVSGRPLSSGLAKCDPPKGEGVWRLKTSDIRLYGWIPIPQSMVLAACELKSVLAAPGPPRDKDLGRIAVKCRKVLNIPYCIGERYDLLPPIN